MPTIGAGNKDAVEVRLNAPLPATLKGLIWTLLDASRKWPSGVVASEIPAQLSSVRPLAKGDPATAANAPVAGVMRNTLIVWSPPFETKSRLLARLAVMRSMPAHATV